MYISGVIKIRKSTLHPIINSSAENVKFLKE